MKLTEIESQKLKDIRFILGQLSIRKYTINPITYIVDVQENVNISGDIGDSLPVRFGTITGNFNIRTSSVLKSLNGFPQHVTGNFSCDVRYMQNRTAVGGPVSVGGHAEYGEENGWCSFEGFPQMIGSYLSVGVDYMKTISGIHKHIKAIGNRLYLYGCNNDFIGGMMGLLLIRGLKIVHHSRNDGEPDSTETKTSIAIDIINKHLAGDKFVTECQLELQDAGLAEYAKM
jgi:hypothetical protein